MTVFIWAMEERLFRKTGSMLFSCEETSEAPSTYMSLYIGMVNATYAGSVHTSINPHGTFELGHC